MYKITEKMNIIQKVTGVEVITENILLEVCKMFPQRRRPREILCEQMAKNFQ